MDLRAPIIREETRYQTHGSPAVKLSVAGSYIMPPHWPVVILIYTIAPIVIITVYYPRLNLAFYNNKLLTTPHCMSAMIPHYSTWR